MKKVIYLIVLLLVVSGFAGFFISTPVSGENEDPEKETPTDDSMTLSIDSVDFSVSLAGVNKVKLKFKVTGTTSTTGNNTTHHIGSSFWTTYYDNGTIENGEVDEYPPEGFEYSDDEMTYEVTSKKENWTEWEIYYETTMKFSIDEQGNISVSLPKVDKVKVFVRAYRDAEGENWTQASKDITSKYKNAWTGILGSEEDDDEDSAGFELVGVLGAIGLLFVGNYTRHRKRKRE